MRFVTDVPRMSYFPLDIRSTWEIIIGNLTPFFIIKKIEHF